MKSYHIAALAGCFLVFVSSVFLSGGMFDQDNGLKGLSLFEASCLLPPPKYDHVPRTPLNVIFESASKVSNDCYNHGLPVGARGCEYAYGSNLIQVRLTLASSEREECEVRHSDGHISEYETTGDANPRHLGWSYR